MGAAGCRNSAERSGLRCSEGVAALLEAALPAVVREELIGGSAGWPDDYIVVRGWSEGTALLHEAMQEAEDKDQVKAAFFARLESRREDWARRMLRSAHVPKGAGRPRALNFLVDKI